MSTNAPETDETTTVLAANITVSEGSLEDVWQQIAALNLEDRNAIQERLRSMFTLNPEEVHIVDQVTLPNRTEILRFVELLQNDQSTIGDLIEQVKTMNSDETVQQKSTLIQRLHGQIVQRLNHRLRHTNEQIAMQMERELTFAFTGKFPS